MTLEEYAAKNPQQEEPAQTEFAEMAADAKARAAALEKAQDLMHSIEVQLEQGTEPQFILYTALKVIALLSNDPGYLERCTGQLEGVYSDLAQYSLFNDNAIIAGERLAAKTTEYNSKLRKQLKRQIADYQKIARELNGALAALDELESAETE